MTYKFLRYTAYVIEVLVFFVVQQIPDIEFYGAKPLLLIPIAVTISMFENETVGIYFGLLCGILIDFGLIGTIGIVSFVLPVLCYLIGLLSVDVVQTNLLTCMIISLVVSFGFFGISFLSTCISNSFVWNAFLNKYLLRMAYTWAVTPFFYFFNKAFSLHIVEKQ